EDVAQMAADARKPELAGRADQALLRLEQHAQTGARYVFELAAVERYRALNLVEEGLGGRALRSVQPAGDHNHIAGAIINCEHPLPLRSRPLRQTPRPWFSGT